MLRIMAASYARMWSKVTYFRHWTDFQPRMELETAQATLVGDRADNQDRAEILIGDEATFAILADGMGGHAKGDLAAETAIASLSASFRGARGRSRAPEGFLNDALAVAHGEVLTLGGGMPPEAKPGTIVVW